MKSVIEPVKYKYITDYTDDVTQISTYYTEDEILIKIKESSSSVLNVEYPSERMCLLAVQLDGMILHDLEMTGYLQTNAIAFTAVQECSQALRSVINQTPKICELALKQSGDNLQYIIDQTEDLCIMAIKEDPNALKFVKNQTIRLCLLALGYRGPRFPGALYEAYKGVKIVPNPDHDTTLENLLNKMELVKMIQEK